MRWRRSEDAFDVGLAYDDPSDVLDRRDYVDEPLEIDTSALTGLGEGQVEYGKAIGGMLLNEPKVRSFYHKALATAAERDIPLHFRLVIDPRAPRRYHAIRWEAIRDPDDGLRIATRHNVLLSRYLSTPDWRPVRSPPWHRLKALIAIASPSDLPDYTRWDMPGVRLEPVDVAEELERAQGALTRMDVRELTGAGNATVKRIIEALDDGIDVFYLVCHGGIYQDEPRLYLENAEGLVDYVDGARFADQIAELERPPTVVVLCSCQSAGNGGEAMTSDGGALSALGPRLAGAGVAAVVGMQGNITMRTASTFIPAFFTELDRHGVIDRAMAVARSRVSDRERDWWMPVLFTRLMLGRAWYEPEFGDRGDDSFRAIIDAIRGDGGSCTPVIGSGVASETILPSREELAASWIDQWLIPIAPQNRADLAKVAQYLSVRTAPRQAQREVGLYLANELRRRFGAVLPEDIMQSEDVRDLIRVVGEQNRRRAGQDDPYAILASLRLPVYVTTSWTSLLEDAIREAGREPDVQYFDWHQRRHDQEDTLVPTRERPLVYHLFGSLDNPASLVVTEDHYFAWLTEWIKRVDKDESIPGRVATALTDRSLLFLGYGLDDWEFRVLFQGIESFPGSVLLKDNLHVGVQVSPEGTVITPEAAQDYLEKYFGKHSVSIYWGTCQRFLTDLASRMRVHNG